MSSQELHCNNNRCQDREICKLATAYKYGQSIIYGLGNNSNECPDFQPKNIEVIDDIVEDTGGIW